MATYVSISAPVALSTTAQIGYPAGITAGDTLLLCAQSDDTTIETTAPGFVPVTDALSGGGGTVRMWTRTVDGTESGTVAVTTPAGVRGVVTMAAYRPDSGLVMAPVADASAVDTDATSTAFSTTGPTLDVLTGEIGRASCRVRV